MPEINPDLERAFDQLGFAPRQAMTLARTPGMPGVNPDLERAFDQLGFAPRANPEEERRLREQEEEERRQREAEAQRERERLANTPGGRLNTWMEANRRFDADNAGRFTSETAIDITRRLPFAGSAVGIAESIGVRNAALRIRDGTAENRDYHDVARFLVNQEQAGNRSFAENVLNIVSYLPGFAAEMAFTGGAFTAGRAGATRAATALAGSAAETAIGRGAIATAGYLGGAALQTAALPHRVTEDAARRAIPGIEQTPQGLQISDNGDLLSHIPAGFLDTMIEVGSERAGAALAHLGRGLTRVPYVGPALESIGARWAGTLPGRTLAAWERGVGQLTQRLGVPYHGIAGEVFEERVGETLRGLFQLTNDYGVVGDVLAGRFGKAGRQLLEEATAFSAVPFAYAAANRAMRSRGRTQAAAMEGTNRVAAAMAAEREADPNMTHAEASRFAEENFTGPERTFAHTIAATFPVEPMGPEALGHPGPQASLSDFARGPLPQPVTTPVKQARSITERMMASLKQFMQGPQSFLNDDVKDATELAIRSGLARKIEVLAANRFTAKQAAEKLGIGVDQVYFIRLGIGIPSQTIGGGMGPSSPNPDFEDWLRDIKQSAAQLQTQVAAPEAPPGAQPSTGGQIAPGPALEGQAGQEMGVESDPTWVKGYTDSLRRGEKPAAIGRAEAPGTPGTPGTGIWKPEAQALSDNPRLRDLYDRVTAGDRAAREVEEELAAREEAGEIVSRDDVRDAKLAARAAFAVAREDFVSAAGMTSDQADVFYDVVLSRRTLELIGLDTGVTRSAISQSWIKAYKKAGMTATSAKEMLQNVTKENSLEMQARVEESDRGVVELQKIVAALDPETKATYRKPLKTSAYFAAKIEALNGRWLKTYEGKPNAKKAKQREELTAKITDLHRRGNAALLAEQQGEARQAEESDSDPGLLYHESGGAAPYTGQPGGKSTGAVGPAELNARMEHDFQTRSYLSARIPGSATAKAAALLHGEAILTRNMSALDPFVRLEEHFHIWSVQNGFQANPHILDRDVAEGFRQFYDAKAPLNKRSMLEGVAQWFVRRTTGSLKNLSEEQQAAADYAEKWIGAKKFTKTANSQKEMFARLPTDPTQIAGGYMSGTGKEVEAPMTVASALESMSADFQDKYDTDLGSLERLRAERKAKGKPYKDVDKAIYTMEQTLRRESALADEWERSGPTVNIDNKRTRVGQSEAEVIGDAKPQYIADITKTPGLYAKVVSWMKGSGAVSAADVYATANHLINEEQRGQAGIDASRDARQAIQAELDDPFTPKDRKDDLRHNLKLATAAHKKSLQDNSVRMNLVSPEMLADYKKAFAQLRTDAEFTQWAEGFVGRLTAAFNSNLDVLAAPEIHRLSPESVQAMKEKFPDFVPTTRVREDADWKGTGSGSREQMQKVIHTRKGGGEQIVAPLVSLKQRRLMTAYQYSEQLRRNAIAEVLSQEGMGNYAVKLDDVQEPRGQADKAAFEEIAEVNQAVAEMIRTQGGATSFSQPWPKDGSKPTWYHYGPGGKLEAYRIGDRAFYELITNRQGDSDHFVQFMRALPKWFPPLRWAAMGVRFGATTFNLSYTTIRNSFPTRDPYEFLKNTIDQASAGRLVEMYPRLFIYESKVALGMETNDPVLRLFMENRGGELRMIGFGSSAVPAVTGSHIVQKAIEKGKQLLRVTSSGELAPRFLEFLNRMKQRGYTEERMKAEVEAADEAAAKGQPWQEPIPQEVIMDAMHFAGEVTVPFHRQGIRTRELNKVMPFFGPAVAGMSKTMRNWKDNPRGAAIAMAGMLSLKLLHWLYYRDEEWYKELSPSDRFANFVVPIPGLGILRLPGPRDLDVPIGGALLTVLDAATNRNPDVPGLIHESLRATLPPGVSHAAVSLAQGKPGTAMTQAALIPTGTIGQVGLDLWRNEGFGGRPIVPRRDEGLPASQQFLEHQLPYAARQLSGGRVPTSLEPSSLLQAAGLVPFSEVKNARRSIDEVYARLDTLSEQRLSARRAVRRFEQEQEFHFLERTAQELTRISQSIRGQISVGGALRQGPAPTPERVRELQERQLSIARRALERIRERAAAN